MAASNIHSVFSMTFPAKKPPVRGFLNISHIFPAIVPFFVSGISHVDTLKNIRNISVVRGVSEAASRRLVKDLEVRDELRSTCRRASHNGGWGTWMAYLGLPLYTAQWYILYIDIYTHMCVATYIIWIHTHIHTYIYIYIYIYIFFIPLGQSLCDACLHDTFPKAALAEHVENGRWGDTPKMAQQSSLHQKSNLVASDWSSAIRCRWQHVPNNLLP